MSLPLQTAKKPAVSPKPKRKSPHAQRVRPVFEQQGLKYDHAVLLGDDGTPVLEADEKGDNKFTVFAPNDPKAQGLHFGCPCCLAPLERIVPNGKKMGSNELAQPLYFRSKHGLKSHTERGCSLDHRNISRSSRNILDFVRDPAPQGHRKILYLNIPEYNGRKVILLEMKTAAAKARYVSRKRGQLTCHFLSAADPMDVATWSVKDGREIARLLTHPMAHSGLIDEIDIVAHGRRFPLREVVVGDNWAGLYAQTQMRAEQGLSYPSMVEVEIAEDQNAKDGIYLTNIDGAGEGWRQIALIVRAGEEQQKIEAMLNKGGRFAVYGFARTLEDERLIAFHNTVRNNGAYINLADLQVLAYTINHKSDLLKLSGGLPARPFPTVIYSQQLQLQL